MPIVRDRHHPWAGQAYLMKSCWHSGYHAVVQYGWMKAAASTLTLPQPTNTADADAATADAVMKVIIDDDDDDAAVEEVLQAAQAAALEMAASAYAAGAAEAESALDRLVNCTLCMERPRESSWRSLLAGICPPVGNASPTQSFTPSPPRSAHTVWHRSRGPSV